MTTGWKWVLGIAGLVALVVVCNALTNDAAEHETGPRAEYSRKIDGAFQDMQGQPVGTATPESVAQANPARVEVATCPTPPEATYLRESGDLLQEHYKQRGRLSKLDTEQRFRAPVILDEGWQADVFLVLADLQSNASDLANLAGPE